MSETRKRKHPSFTDPSSIAPPHPGPHPRRSLQRASKDRAYAERLASAGDTVASLNGSAIANAGKDADRKRSKPAKKPAARVKSSRSVKTESLPPGWPFVDPSRSKKSRKSNSRRERESVESEQPSGSDAKPQEHTIRFIEGGDLPVLTRRQSNLLSSVTTKHESLSFVSTSNLAVTEEGSKKQSSSTKIKDPTQSPKAAKQWICEKCTLSNSKRCKKCKACGSNLVDASECSSVKKLSECETMDGRFIVTTAPCEHTFNEGVDNTHLNTSEGERITDNVQSTPISEHSGQSVKSTPPKSKSWTCSRCTLSNSIRRKKCQVCGNLRNLSVTLDGTFALGDGGQSASGSSGARICDSMEQGAYAVELLQSNTSQAASNASFSSSDHLFAIASEPVSTRSRFKQQRLSQEITQPMNRTNSSQQFSLTHNLFKRHSGGDSCENDTSSNKQQSDSEISNSFRMKMVNHRKRRRDRERATRAKRYLRHTGNVKVRIRLLLGGAKFMEEANCRLSAYVPNEVMPFAKDDTGESDSSNTLDVRGATDSKLDRNFGSQAEVRVRVSLAGDSLDSESHDLAAFVPFGMISPESSEYGQDDEKVPAEPPFLDDSKVEVSIRLFLEGASIKSDGLVACIRPEIIMSSTSDGVDEVLQRSCNKKGITIGKLVEQNEARDTINSLPIEEQSDGNKNTEATRVDCADFVSNFSGHLTDVQAKLALAEDELDAAKVLSSMQLSEDGDSSQDHTRGNEEGELTAAIARGNNTFGSDENDGTQVALQMNEIAGQDLPDGTTLHGKPQIEADNGIDSAKVGELIPVGSVSSRIIGTVADNKANETGNKGAAENHDRAQVSFAASIVTSASCATQQKCSLVDTMYIPMTQQMTEFDYEYFSQTSKELLQQKTVDPHHTETYNTDPFSNSRQCEAANCNEQTLNQESHGSKFSHNDGGSEAKDEATSPSDTNEKTREFSVPKISTSALADAKSVIKVSEESLSKASSYSEYDSSRNKTNSCTDHTAQEECNQNRLPPLMFQTAGTKEVLEISDEALARVENFFCGYTSTGTACNVAVVSALYQEACDKIEPPPTMKMAVQLSTQHIPMFQTADKKTEHITKAKKLLSCEDNVNVAPSGSITAGRIVVNTEKSHQLPIFQTAGKKLSISVSAASLSKANELFSDDPSSLSRRTLDKVATIFHTAGKKQTIQVSADGLSKANAMFEIHEEKTDSMSTFNSEANESIDSADMSQSSKAQLPKFQTAGSKMNIQVSDEALSKVNKLFDLSSSLHVLSEGKMPCRNQQAVDAGARPVDAKNNAPALSEFQTAAKKTTMKVSEECISNASTSLNDDIPNRKIDTPFSLSSKSLNAYSGSSNSDIISKQPYVPMFQTAGKNTAIEICDESLSHASKLFHCSSTSCGAEREASSEEMPAAARAPAKDMAGKNSTSVKLAPISKVETLHVSRFQTTGQNTMINASQESLSHAGNLFDYDEITSESCAVSNNNNTLNASLADSLLYKSEFPIEVGNASASASHVVDQSISTESTVRLRKRNRVRFSFDPAELFVVGQHGGMNAIEEMQQTSMQDLASFVTPDSRQQCTVGGENKGIDGFDDHHNSSQTSELKSDAANDSSPTNLREFNDIYTPLHRTDNSYNMQSEIKSKRLFYGASADKRSQACGATPHDTGIQRWYIDTDQQKCNRIPLGHFSLNTTTRSNCLENGVSDVTLRITSINASKLRFDINDGSPLFIVGQKDAPKGINVGKVTDIRKWLLEQGCNESLFCDKWIQNHYRMIVWKLAAMERSFSKELGGQYLTYDHVLKQMKGRYERELQLAKRPAVRKLLNRDVSANMPVILCVSQILKFRTKADKPGVSKEEVRLELTDGWYSLPATMDNVLLQMLEKGKIKVGTKLMICNGVLLGSEDGVDPLDDSYSSSKRDCPLCLSINANCTRLSRWDAKLGFVSPRNSKLDGGSFIVKSLSDIFVDGGPIPAIDLIICKRYPKMYLEEVNGQSLHLTEAEDAARQIEYNMRHQRASEKFADMAQKECVEELEYDAPEEWKMMHLSNSPEEYYEQLGTFEKKLVDDWTTKRAALLQSMVSKSIEDSMKDDQSTERKSKSYVKLLVVAYNSRGDAEKKTAAQMAELTIWRVSDEQFELLREGSVVRMRNLAVKTKIKRGMLQLSANQETPMKTLLKQPNHEQLVQCGYSHRLPKSFVHINNLAKQQIGAKSAIEHEFDVVACAIKVSKIADNTTVLYLTDESGLIIKVKRDHKAKNTDPFSVGTVALPVVVSFCNLLVSSFDEHDHCAVATWGLMSCVSKSNRSMQDRYDELQLWSTSEDGVKCCGIVVDKINAGIPFGTDHFIKTKVCFGYIICFEGDQIGQSSGANIVIDYSCDVIKAWLPMYLVEQAIQLFEKDCTLDIPLLVGVPLLNHLTRRNQKLVRFVLKEALSYGGEFPLLEVIGLSLAKVDELARLHFL